MAMTEEEILAKADSLVADSQLLAEYKDEYGKLEADYEQMKIMKVKVDKQLNAVQNELEILKEFTKLINSIFYINFVSLLLLTKINNAIRKR